MAYDAKSIVAKGALSLDEVCPDWAQRVNPDGLDIQFENKCILAQLFGHHFTGLKVLGLGDGCDVTHGFRHNPYGTVSGEEQYEALNSEWKKIISKRLTIR